MFNSVSMAGVGGLITIVIAILKMFGVELPEGAGGQITEAVTTLIGLGLLVWGQLRRTDLKMGIVRK